MELSYIQKYLQAYLDEEVTAYNKGYWPYCRKTDVPVSTEEKSTIYQLALNDLWEDAEDRPGCIQRALQSHFWRTIRINHPEEFEQHDQIHHQLNLFN